MTKNPKPAIQITRRGLLVWIGLVVFFAGWMFVLGILVGRGTAPVSLNAHQLEKELAELKARMVQKEQAKVEAQASGKGGQKPELGFYEALKQSKPQKGLKIKTAPGSTPKADVAQAPKPAPKPRRKVKRAKVDRAPDKISAARKSEAAPAPETLTRLQPIPSVPSPKPPASDAKRRFTVQVAAFKELNGAVRRVAELRRRGYPAYQVRTQLNGKGVWYRVRVGAFGNKASADKMLRKLDADRIKGMVVATP